MSYNGDMLTCKYPYKCKTPKFWWLYLRNKLTDKAENATSVFGASDNPYDQVSSKTER